MSEYLNGAILYWIEPANALRLCSVLNGITQFYLPPIHFIPARAEQGLEHFIRNELVNVASHFTNLGRMEAWVKLSAREWSWTSTVHDWTCIWVGALTNWASQADILLTYPRGEPLMLNQSIPNLAVLFISTTLSFIQHWVLVGPVVSALERCKVCPLP